MSGRCLDLEDRVSRTKHGRFLHSCVPYHGIDPITRRIAIDGEARQKRPEGERRSTPGGQPPGHVPAQSTVTLDEESNAEGSDSSTSGHGATGGSQDSEREDDSDADCGPATPTATAPASPGSHPSPATDPKAAPVANPRRSPRVRTIWSEYVPLPSLSRARENPNGFTPPLPWTLKTSCGPLRWTPVGVGPEPGYTRRLGKQ